jgi:hypothetical protein
MITYIANHGEATMAPGPGNYGPEIGWLPYPQYNKMTSAISKLGVLMGTDPITGTSGTGEASGLRKWVDSGGTAWWFSVSQTSAGSFWSPGFNDVASAALGGATVAPGVG